MDYSQEKMHQSGMLNSQLGAAVAPENPLLGLMRDYVRAKERFDELCHARQQVLQQHNEAEKQLNQLSEKVAQVVSQGMYDPTAPQPAVAVPNGIYNSGGQVRF